MTEPGVSTSLAGVGTALYRALESRFSVIYDARSVHPSAEIEISSDIMPFTA